MNTELASCFQIQHAHARAGIEHEIQQPIRGGDFYPDQNIVEVEGNFCRRSGHSASRPEEGMEEEKRELRAHTARLAADVPRAGARRFSEGTLRKVQNRRCNPWRNLFMVRKSSRPALHEITEIRMA